MYTGLSNSALYDAFTLHLSVFLSHFLSLWRMTDLWLKWMCNSTPTRVLALVTLKPEVVCVCVVQERLGKELAEMRQSTCEWECENKRKWVIEGNREMSLESLLLGLIHLLQFYWRKKKEKKRKKERKKTSTHTENLTLMSFRYTNWAWDI